LVNKEIYNMDSKMKTLIGAGTIVGGALIGYKLYSKKKAGKPNLIGAPLGPFPVNTKPVSASNVSLGGLTGKEGLMGLDINTIAGLGKITTNTVGGILDSLGGIFSTNNADLSDFPALGIGDLSFGDDVGGFDWGGISFGDDPFLESAVFDDFGEFGDFDMDYDFDFDFLDF
jgi:hypothetical protein